MSKLFAFIPTAQWGIDAARETLIRFGHSKHGVEKFTGPLEPRLPLLMCVPVKDGQEASFKLKQILRGNEPYVQNHRFKSWADFRPSAAGDNYCKTDFKLPLLKTLFETIARLFQEEEQPPVEFQPGEGEAPRDRRLSVEYQPGEGEVVQVRAMSSAQAAAILCGIPGSVEAVLNN